MSSLQNQVPANISNETNIGMLREATKLYSTDLPNFALLILSLEDKSGQLFQLMNVLKP